MGARGPLASVTPLPGTTFTTPKGKRVTFDPKAPNPPTNLTREALAEWKRVVPKLNDKGLLAEIDRAVLVAYCDAWDKFTRARKQLDTGKLTILSGSDQRPAKNPAWQIYTQSAQLIAQLSKELFATPNARLRAQLPEADDGEAGDGILD